MPKPYTFPRVSKSYTLHPTPCLESQTLRPALSYSLAFDQKSDPRWCACLFFLGACATVVCEVSFTKRRCLSCTSPSLSPPLPFPIPAHYTYSLFLHVPPLFLSHSSLLFSLPPLPLGTGGLLRVGFNIIFSLFLIILAAMQPYSYQGTLSLTGNTCVSQLHFRARMC